MRTFLSSYYYVAIIFTKTLGLDFLCFMIQFEFHIEGESLNNAMVDDTNPFSFSSLIFRFIIEDENTFFTPAQRSLLTYQILSRAVYEDVGDKTKNKFGEEQKRKMKNNN